MIVNTAEVISKLVPVSSDVVAISTADPDFQDIISGNYVACACIDGSSVHPDWKPKEVIKESKLGKTFVYKHWDSTDIQDKPRSGRPDRRVNDY